MAGVLGSLVGGSASVATTWVTQPALSKRELLRAEIRRRETLYGEFISECSARIIDSFERTLEKPETLLHAYAIRGIALRRRTPEWLNFKRTGTASCEPA